MFNNVQVKRFLIQEYNGAIEKYEINSLDLLKKLHSLYEYTYKEIIRFVISSDEGREVREELGKYETENNVIFGKMIYGRQLGFMQAAKLLEKFIKMTGSERTGLRIKRLQSGWEFGKNEEFSKIRNQDTHLDGKKSTDNETIEWLCKKGNEGFKDLFFGIFQEEIDAEKQSLQETIKEIKVKLNVLNDNNVILAKEYAYMLEVLKCDDNYIPDKFTSEIVVLLNSIVDKLLHPDKVSKPSISKQMDITVQPAQTTQAVTGYYDVSDDSDQISLNSKISEYRITGVKCFQNEVIYVKNFTKAVISILQSLGEIEEYNKMLHEIRNVPMKYGISERFFLLGDTSDAALAASQKIESLDFDICTNYSTDNLKGILIKLLIALKIPQNQIIIYGFKKNVQ